MGIILPFRSKLVFPGGPAQFNPNHPVAAAGCGFCGTASNGTFSNLLNAKIGSNFGTNSTKIAGIGPSLKYVDPNSGTTFSGNSSATIQMATIACIIIPGANTISTQSNVFSNGDSGTGQGLVLSRTATGSVDFIAYGNAATVTGVTVLSAGIPYFIIASANGSVASPLTNFLVLNLMTGQLITLIDNSNAVNNLGVSGNYIVGNRSTLTAGPDGSYLAAVMYSPTFLSIPQLRQWAQDPWSFWYPNTLDLGKMLATSQAPPPVIVPTDVAGYAQNSW